VSSIDDCIFIFHRLQIGILHSIHSKPETGFNCLFFFVFRKTRKLYKKCRSQSIFPI